MFVTQEEVNCVLKKLGPSLLKKKYQKQWSIDNPTYGYCYVVSEAIYHYIKADIVKSYCISLEDNTHWFIVADDVMYDFTSEQFKTPLSYDNAVCRGFLKGSIQTPRGYISKRGYEIAELLNLVEERK